MACYSVQSLHRSEESVGLSGPQTRQVRICALFLIGTDLRDDVGRLDQLTVVLASSIPN